MRPGRTPPSGEYAVFHERPYPKRLDRAFRIGAIVVGAAAAVAIAWSLFMTAPRASTDLVGALAAAAFSLAFAALAYGFTRAVGMIVVGIYGGLQRKQYVIDWDDGSGR
jgi:hypothetical protein